MKRYISILFSVILLVFTCCGCSLFNDNAKKGILSIPRKGQEYYKRVIYKSNNSSVTTNFTFDYLSVIDSEYDSNNEKSIYKSILFDKNAKPVFDGADEKLTALLIINDKAIKLDVNDKKYYLIDMNSGNKEEFFNGYIPLDYKNGYWTVKNESEKWGILDDKGNEVIPCKYDVISNFDNKGYALVGDYTEQKFGMIDKDNNLVIPINYTYLIPFNAQINSYFSDLYIKTETTYDYTLVSDSNENVFTIDRNGDKVFEISDSEYKSVSGLLTLSQNMIPVEKDGLCGYIDMQGNEVIPLKYNEIAWDFINGYSCVSVGSNYGIINVKGEEILPFEYSSITPFDQNGLAIARTNNSSETQIIDLAGNVAYSTNNSIEAIGGGYFKEKLSDSNTEIIQITTDKGDYETYTPKEFILD